MLEDSTAGRSDPNDTHIFLQRERFVSDSTWRWLRYIFLAIELVVIALWTLNVTAELRGTSKFDLIGGRDYFVSVQGRFFWDHVKACGTCALWNGDTRGGAPAYVDANVDMFHPIVAIPAYLAGTLQGSKITVILALFMGGLAVWWLALEIGIGSIARVIVACMAVASGSMLGKLQEGLVVLITATAAAFLILPALLRITKHPNRRNAGLLGLILGLAVISGQGYIQLGIAIMAPLVLILIVGNPNGWKSTGGYLIFGGVVGLLISMIFVYPFGRVYGDFAKVLDVTFGAYQPMKYQLLNLAISDLDFLEADYLHKLGFAAWYVNYIGWIPIGLALIGVGIQWQRSKRIALFLGLSFLAALWVGSGRPFQLLAAPDFTTQDMKTFAWSIRIPSFVSALAIPPLLGFAAVAIDAGLHATLRIPANATTFWAKLPRLDTIGTIAARLAIIALLAVSLQDLHRFARDWIWIDHIDPQRVETFVAKLSTEDLAWVSPMDNDTTLQVLGMDAGLKWSDAWRSWYFDGQPYPDTYLALQSASDEREGMRRTGEWEGYSFYESLAGNQYVSAPEGGQCNASGEGGHIDLSCSLPSAGMVVVQELNRGSWEATIDGASTPVVSEAQWVAFEAPAGASTIQLRYRPTDFWIGASLSVVGLILAVLLMILPTRYRFHLSWNRRLKHAEAIESST